MQNQIAKALRKINLGEICFQITDGKHGDCENEMNSGYYFISSKDVYDGYIHYENAREITENDFINTHKRTKLESGDILITNSGTIGRMAFIKNDNRTNKTTFQKSVAILKPNKEKTDNVFLYFYLITCYDQLVNLSGGAAQHNLLLGDLRKFPLFIPKNISYQRKIASILSSFDELIENNRRRIEILEEMAQLLYREWFVEFRFPGHEKVKFVDSALGKIPEGWEIIKATEMLRFSKGFEPGANNYFDKKIEGLINFYRVSDLGKGGIAGNFIDHKVKEEFLCKYDDVLISLDATLGRVAIGCEGAYSSGIRKVYPKKGIIHKSFIHFWLKSKYVQDSINIYAKGATILHAGASIKYLNLIFNEIIYQNFYSIIDPMFNEILVTQQVNTKLIIVRNLLLPKLMSGEIEV